MNALAPIDTVAAPTPLEVLRIRAWARAELYAAGEIVDMAEAVDPLQKFAEASGLADEMGHDAVQAILAREFWVPA